MTTVIEKTLEAIKREHIAPKSRERILLRRFAHWAVGAVMIMVAALTLAAGYELVLDLDWDVTERQFARRNFFVFGSLPYFWIVLSLLLSLLAVIAVRKTENGYRFSSAAIIGGVLSAIILSGLLFAYGHAGMRMHDSFRSSLPFYDQLVESREMRWSRPENGYLGGTIAMAQPTDFELQGFRGERYLIRVTPKTDIAPAVTIRDGERVRVICAHESGNTYVAEVIRPFHKPGKGPGRNMPLPIDPMLR